MVFQFEMEVNNDGVTEVRQLLSDDPKNSEFLAMEKELVEVIALIDELLETAKQNDGSSELVAGTSGEVSHSLHARSSIHVVCCLNLPK
ncbi:hypothetical protein ACS0TY_022554 [Phlomoides rotata]